MNTYEKKYKKIMDEMKKGKRQSPLTVIRLNCLECMGFESRDCGIPECILYKFRSGRNLSGKRGSRKVVIGSKNDTKSV